MVKLPSTDSVRSYAVGLNKGYVVTRVTPRTKPSSKKGTTSKRVREIRKLMRSVCDLNPLEKKAIEMFKTEVAKVEKRAFKLLKKRLGKRSRAIKKRDELHNLIKMAAKK